VKQIAINCKPFDFSNANENSQDHSCSISLAIEKEGKEGDEKEGFLFSIEE